MAKSNSESNNTEGDTLSPIKVKSISGGGYTGHVVPQFDLDYEWKLFQSNKTEQYLDHSQYTAQFNYLRSVIYTIQSELTAEEYVRKNFNIELADITYEKLVKVLNRLKSLCPLTRGQKSKILNYVDNHGTAELLNALANFRNVSQVDTLLVNELTYSEYVYLTKKIPDIDFDNIKDEFNIVVRDYPLEWTSKWEYGYQQSHLCSDGHMYYLKFYNFMMLDYDGINYEELIKILDDFIVRQPDFKFHIYRTYNGFHVFITSHIFPYNHLTCVRLMRLLKVDPWYILFSYKNGYKVRLSRKLGRDESEVASFVATRGNGIDQESNLQLLSLLETFTGGHDVPPH